MFSMYKSSCIVTLTSLLVIWCAKIYENLETHSIAFDMVTRARLLYDESHEKDLFLKIQTLSMAFALISYARSHNKDFELQRATSINVAKLQRKIDNKLASLRKHVK